MSRSYLGWMPSSICSASGVRLLGLLGSLFCLGSAMAQQAPDTSIALSAYALPRYDGAKQYHVLPLPDVTLANSPFFIQGLGGGMAIPINHYLLFGPLASIELGRKESASERLTGMGDLDNNLQLGGFLRWHAGPASIGLRFTQSSHAGYGNRIGLTSDYALLDQERDQIHFSSSLTWMNGAAMQTYFGVDAQQAQNSEGNLQAYHPAAGLSRADVRLAWDHRFSYHWSVRTMAGLEKLLGDAAGSPVVERATTPYAALGLAYHF